MNENHNDYNYSKKEALYKRMFKFAKDCRALVKRLPKISANSEDSKQLNRSSGSVGANYIEAWDAISKKDELHRLKISRKEAKESKHWLELLDCEDNQSIEKERKRLSQEALELTKILSTIVGIVEIAKNG